MQLIEDAAECPEIGGVVIRFLLHQLRRHVQWSTLDGGQDQRVHAHGTSKPAERKHVCHSTVGRVLREIGTQSRRA